MHSLGLNVTVQSYAGSLDWGLIACRKAMPDLPELAKYMQAAHQELLQLTPVVAAEKASELAPLKLVVSKSARAKPAARKKRAA